MLRLPRVVPATTASSSLSLSRASLRGVVSCSVFLQMSRPSRQRRPSAALKFLEGVLQRPGRTLLRWGYGSHLPRCYRAESEAKWEERQQQLAATASVRRKARKQREKQKGKSAKGAVRAHCRMQQRVSPRTHSQFVRAPEKKGKASNGGPKKPTSAYFFFVAENRDDVKAENPDADFGTVSRILGNEWRSLSEDERAHFDDLALKDKHRYQRELAAFNGEPMPPAPKKSRASKAKPSRATAGAAPSSYFEYCAEAIGALRDRSGSSYAAIEKFITTNHPDLDFKRHHFRAALKRGAENGSFIKVKASFKLDQSLKKLWQRYVLAMSVRGECSNSYSRGFCCVQQALADCRWVRRACWHVSPHISRSLRHVRLVGPLVPSVAVAA